MGKVAKKHEAGEMRLKNRDYGEKRSSPMQGLSVQQKSVPVQATESFFGWVKWP